MHPIGQRKFQTLPPCRQHRHCADLLSVCYQTLLACNMARYEELLSWMVLDLPPLSLNPKDISDRYHWHLREAKWHLKEDHFLPFVHKKDNPSKTSFLPVAIYLDNLRSAHNVGSILRTAEALRIGSIHCSPQTPSTNHQQTIRASMGTSSIVPCFTSTSIQSLPRPWIALETAADAIPLEKFLFPPSFTLILGNEEYGISDELLSLADQFISIPLCGFKNSLNVACAFAIAAHAIRAQHSHLNTELL